MSDIKTIKVTLPIIAVPSVDPTNLTYTASTTNGVVVSSTGTDATIPLVGANAGLASPSDKTKIDTIDGKMPIYSIDTRLTQDSTQDSQYIDGNFSLHELGFKTGNAKAILALRNAMVKADSDSQYFPYRQLFSDSVGRGHVNWSVTHYILNKGYPTSWTNNAGTAFAGGGACAYIGLEIDRTNLTTDSIYDATEALTNGGHIFTKTGHGFVNQQPITITGLTGFDTATQTFTRGLQYGHGSTYYVKVLTADTFQLFSDKDFHTNGARLPVALSASRTFPSLPSAITGATYAQTDTTLTVTKNAHGLTRGDRLKMTFTNGTGKPVDKLYEVMTTTTNTFTLEACLGVKETTAVSGDCSYIVNPTTFLFCSWDIHQHKSDESAWSDGTVNTYDGTSYGEGDRLVRRVNGLEYHFADCKVSYTAPSGQNLDFVFGTAHNRQEWALRRSNLGTFDFLRFANNATGIQETIRFARFDNTPTGLFEIEVPVQLDSGIVTSSSTTPILKKTTQLSRNVETESYDAILTTTDATVTTLKAFPAITVTTDGMARYRFTIEATRTTGVQPQVSVYTGEILMIRGGGSTTVFNLDVTHISNNITGLTVDSISATGSAGVINLRVTGVSATTINWTLRSQMFDNN